MRRRFRALFLRFREALSSPQALAVQKGVSIGKDCRILTRNLGTEPWLISIGDRVTISGGACLLTHDGSGSLYTDEEGRRYNFRRITIGSDVFIGTNAILLPGVAVGDRVIVGAGSVVTRSIPSGSVVAGNPARIVGSFTSTYANMRTWPATAQIYGPELQYRTTTTEAASRTAMREELSV